jgi:hypothetical protein
MPLQLFSFLSFVVPLQLRIQKAIPLLHSLLFFETDQEIEEYYCSLIEISTFEISAAKSPQTTLLQNQTAKYTNQAKIFHPTHICRTHYNFHPKSTEKLLKIQNSRKQPKIKLISISLYTDQKINENLSSSLQPNNPCT